MPYDKELDKDMFKESVEFETSRITVGVFSYNNGEKKLQISRENRDPNNDWRFSKLGRMVKNEVEVILPLIQKAIEKM